MELRAFTSNSSHKDVCYEGANGGPHSCTLDLLILTLEKEVKCWVRQNSSRDVICDMDCWFFVEGCCLVVTFV